MAYNDCHFSSGNTQCPAEEIQIAVVGEAVHLATKVKEARKLQDLTREAKILAHVAKKSRAFQYKFNEHLK